MSYNNLCSSKFATCIISMSHMWQSQVEIKDYSVAYFDHVTAFVALYRSISVKGGAHTRYVELSGIDAALLRV